MYKRCSEGCKHSPISPALSKRAPPPPPPGHVHSKQIHSDVGLSQSEAGPQPRAASASSFAYFWPPNVKGFLPNFLRDYT
jgi:hypothetical protein